MELSVKPSAQLSPKHSAKPSFKPSAKPSARPLGTCKEQMLTNDSPQKHKHNPKNHRASRSCPSLKTVELARHETQCNKSTDFWPKPLSFPVPSLLSRYPLFSPLLLLFWSRAWPHQGPLPAKASFCYAGDVPRRPSPIRPIICICCPRLRQIIFGGHRTKRSKMED